ncbi:hypothetical protein BC829DRAFT_416828 [Chytridium lagenaria]|nr:hypothetical protein BC829DRAFT_416828 [Chytridium lagenaria]
MSKEKQEPIAEGQFSDAEEDHAPDANQSSQPHAAPLQATISSTSSSKPTSKDFPPLPINPSFVPKFNRTIALSDPGTPTEPSSPGESNTDGGGADADGEGDEESACIWGSTASSKSSEVGDPSSMNAPVRALLAKKQTQASSGGSHTKTKVDAELALMEALSAKLLLESD